MVKRMTLREYLTGRNMPLLYTESPLLSEVPEFLKEVGNQNILVQAANILYGSYTLLDDYSLDPDQLAIDITAWYAVNKYRYEGLYESTKFDYNPIENYRMEEEGRDAAHVGGQTSNETIGERIQHDSYGQGQDTNVRSVAPYETEVFKHESQNVVTTSSHDDIFTVNQQNNTYTSGERDDSTTHKLIRSGNIGVTTSQQMIESERTLRNFSVLKIVAKDIMENYCYRVQPLGRYVIVD